MYLDLQELIQVTTENYDISLELAAAEAFGGKYEADELGSMVNHAEIVQEALRLIN